MNHRDTEAQRAASPAKGWAIAQPRTPTWGWRTAGGSTVLGFTFAGTRAEAIRNLVRLYPRAPENTWDYWRRRGHRAVRVELREVG